MSSSVPVFDANGYRKRVLAAVFRRGGPDTSDAFELYDVPVEDVEQWTDARVAAQVAEVWAFWQRQRDHPKYGTLTGLLVEGHAERSAPLLDPYQRAGLTARVRAERERRDGERFALLDQAIRRLVERHRGVPRDKVDGLVEVGALGGLTADEVRARLRRHRTVAAVGGAPVVPAPGPDATVSDHRRQQVRDLLDEFGRLQEVPPPPTLLALLGLDPDCSRDDITTRARAWRVRCRELPPSRVRAVADELMVHVHDLLESGRDVLEGYLDVVAEDVAARLRPRVRAAVLVEDRLVADDHEHLFSEAQAQGLDPARAARVLASIAAELGVPIDPFGATVPAAPVRPGRDRRGWERPLRAARAALREGRLIEARRLVDEASRVADASGTTPVRAVADEIEDAITEAELRWRAVATAVGARRFAEAIEHLEQLCRTAIDVPSPSGSGRADHELDRARREVAVADEQVALAVASDDPSARLLAVLDRWPGHPGAVAALAALPLHPPTDVRAVRDRSGAVLVTWQPSATAGVTYRVARVLFGQASPRVIARTPSTGIEDGGAGPGPTPEYVVVAVRAGQSSDEARTAAAPSTAPEPSPPVVPVVPVAPPLPPPEPTPRPAPIARATRPRPSARPPRPTPAALDAPSDVTARRTPVGAVLVRWTGPAGAEFKVSRKAVDGRWQVVGRTRATSLEDGGALPSGPLPEYAVVAALDGAVSDEGRSPA